MLPYEQEVGRFFPEGLANAAGAKKAYADLLVRTAPTLARLKAQAEMLPHLMLPGRTGDIAVFAPSLELVLSGPGLVHLFGVFARKLGLPVVPAAPADVAAAAMARPLRRRVRSAASSAPPPETLR